MKTALSRNRQSISNNFRLEQHSPLSSSTSSLPSPSEISSNLQQNNKSFSSYLSSSKMSSFPNLSSSCSISSTMSGVGSSPLPFSSSIVGHSPGTIIGSVKSEDVKVESPTSDYGDEFSDATDTAPDLASLVENNNTQTRHLPENNNHKNNTKTQSALQGHQVLFCYYCLLILHSYYITVSVSFIYNITYTF